MALYFLSIGFNIFSLYNFWFLWFFFFTKKYNRCDSHYLLPLFIIFIPLAFAALDGLPLLLPYVPFPIGIIYVLLISLLNDTMQSAMIPKNIPVVDGSGIAGIYSTLNL